MKHLNRYGLVTLNLREETPQTLPALVLGGHSLSGLQALRSSLGRNNCGEIGNLLRLKSQKLIASLACLQGSCRSLTCGDQRRHLSSVAIEITDDGRLHSHRVLQTCQRVLPAHLCVGDKKLIRCGGGSWRISSREGPVDLLN